MIKQGGMDILFLGRGKCFSFVEDDQGIEASFFLVRIVVLCCIGNVDEDTEMASEFREGAYCRFVLNAIGEHLGKKFPEGFGATAKSLSGAVKLLLSKQFALSTKATATR